MPKKPLKRPNRYPDDPQKAFAASLRLLVRRSRSEAEIRTYLARREYTPSAIDTAIQMLTESKLLNDTEFARAWVESRQRHKPKGRRVLEMELKNKGINDELIQQAVEDTNDYEAAKQVFEKKKWYFSRYSGDKYKRKVADYLGRRGFSFDVIMKILKEE